MAKKAAMKVVSVIQKDPNDPERSYFKKCGVAFVNSDDSLNMKLDLFPNVTFHIGEKYDPEKHRQPGDEEVPY